jgi:hypothetical protein
MPLTFAHPAIVLPLSRLSNTFFSVTALIAGSVVPDFEYFIRLHVYSVYSHTLPGLFYFDLPLGMIIYLLYVQFVRDPFLVHLPGFLRERFARPFRPAHWLVVLLSLLTGAASHILWDAFTHSSGFMVRHVSSLRLQLHVGALLFPLYRLIQHASTVVGLVILAIVIMRLPRTPWRSPRRAYYWRVVVTVCGVMLCVKLLLKSDMSLGDGVVTAISAGLSGILVASLFARVHLRW